MLVTAVDGSQPRFSLPHYRARVAESAGRRSPVITLEAAAPSPSAGLDSALVFQLTSQQRPALFDVDFTTGTEPEKCPFISSHVDDVTLLFTVAKGESRHLLFFH